MSSPSLPEISPYRRKAVPSSKSGASEERRAGSRQSTAVARTDLSSANQDVASGWARTLAPTHAQLAQRSRRARERHKQPAATTIEKTDRISTDTRNNTKVAHPTLPSSLEGDQALDASNCKPVPPQTVVLREATSFVSKIKQRFVSTPQMYLRFLGILKGYSEKQRSPAEVYMEVDILFKDHQDLVEIFRYYLPQEVLNKNIGKGEGAGVAAKRNFEEVEGDDEPERSQRAKVSHGEISHPNQPSTSRAPEANRIAPLTSSTISRTMPLPGVVSLLIRHKCQDITQALDLSACSEYAVSSGGFGDIYQGKLNDGTLVAVKCMRIVVDPHSNKHEKHLKAKGQTDLNRPRMCMQIAEGLAFLHQRKVVHGDLKAANVLVSEAHEPLLADFGSATLQERTLQFTYTTARSNFSVRWAAPELLGESPLSVAADVYALGMTILEVITGNVPYAELKRDPAVMNSINNGQHPKRPQAHIPTKSKHGNVLWELLTCCWAFEAESRPSAQLVQDKMAVITPKGLTFQETSTEA